MDIAEEALRLTTQTQNIPCYSTQLTRDLHPKNIVMVARINEVKSSFCAILSHFFSLCYRWLAVDISLTASRLGKYPPLATANSVNSCQLAMIHFYSDKVYSYDVCGYFFRELITSWVKDKLVNLASKLSCKLSYVVWINSKNWKRKRHLWNRETILFLNYFWEIKQERTF